MDLRVVFLLPSSFFPLPFGVAPLFPDDVRSPGTRVRHAGQHEQQVGEAVEILQQAGAHGLFPAQRYQPPFGAAADGARDVQRRGQ